MKTELQNAQVALQMMPLVLEQLEGHLNAPSTIGRNQTIEGSFGVMIVLERLIEDQITYLQKDKNDSKEGKNIREAERTLTYYCQKFNELIKNTHMQNIKLPDPNYDIGPNTIFNKEENRAFLNRIAKLAIDATNLINTTSDSKMAWLHQMTAFFKKNNLPQEFINQAEQLIEIHLKVLQSEVKLAEDMDAIMNSIHKKASVKIAEINKLISDTIKQLPPGYPATYFDQYQQKAQSLDLMLQIEKKNDIVSDLNEKLQKILVATNIKPSQKLIEINALLTNENRLDANSLEVEYFNKSLSVIKNDKVRKDIQNFIQNQAERNNIISSTELREIKVNKGVQAVLNSELGGQQQINKIEHILNRNRNRVVAELMGEDRLRLIVGDNNYIKLKNDDGNLRFQHDVNKTVEKLTKDNQPISELISIYERYGNDNFNKESKELFEQTLISFVAKRLSDDRTSISANMRFVYGELGDHPAQLNYVGDWIKETVKQYEEKIITKINKEFDVIGADDFISKLNALELSREHHMNDIAQDIGARMLPMCSNYFYEKNKEFCQGLIKKLNEGNIVDKLKIVSDINKGLLKVVPPEVSAICEQVKQNMTSQNYIDLIKNISQNSEILYHTRLKDCEFLIELGNLSNNEEAKSMLSNLKSSLSLNDVNLIQSNKNLNLFDKMNALELLSASTDDVKIIQKCADLNKLNTKSAANEIIAASRATFQQFSMDTYVNATEKNKYSSPIFHQNEKLVKMIVNDILKCSDPNQRVNAIARWIDISEVCLKQRDFNSAFAIGLALVNENITKLSTSFAGLSPESKEKLKILNVFSSFEYSDFSKRFRQDSNLPTVPYQAPLDKWKTMFAETRRVTNEKDEHLSSQQESWMNSEFANDVIPSLIKSHSLIRDQNISEQSFNNFSAFMQSGQMDNHQQEHLRKTYESPPLVSLEDKALAREEVKQMEKDYEVLLRANQKQNAIDDKARKENKVKPVKAKDLQKLYSSYVSSALQLKERIDAIELSQELKDKLNKQIFNLIEKGVDLELQKEAPQKAIIETTLYILKERVTLIKNEIGNSSLDEQVKKNLIGELDALLSKRNVINSSLVSSKSLKVEDNMQSTLSLTTKVEKKNEQQSEYSRYLDLKEKYNEYLNSNMEPIKQDDALKVQELKALYKKFSEKPLNAQISSKSFVSTHQDMNFSQTTTPNLNVSHEPRQLRAVTNGILPGVRNDDPNKKGKERDDAHEYQKQRPK